MIDINGDVWIAQIDLEALAALERIEQRLGQRAARQEPLGVELLLHPGKVPIHDWPELKLPH